MRYFKFVGLAVVLFVSAFLLSSYSDTYYFKINKSFEIYGEVFRRLSGSYVHEIDPERLMKEGIEGMLADLDPYTVFIDETDSENIDIITYGRYTGLGISVGKVDGELTITGVHEDYPAARAGIRIGDRILQIDSVKVLDEATEILREYTRGEEGSTVDLLVLRTGVADTLKFTLKRERIQLENVPYAGLLEDSIAYIRLDRFSKTSAADIRSSIYELRRKAAIKGLILDLRGNPGGVLEAAISICEIFIEPGNVIVSTKGREVDEARTYKSISKPIEPDIPLVVLIDQGSASASEIVAGAIQDLDRGIIVGENSVGKGLVQTVFSLPFKTNLKVTTAKYYTPSGRCIQKIDYSPKHDEGLGEDTLYFKTKNGRKVPELVGIKPDSVVHYKEYSEFVNDLEEENMFFGFANVYRSKHDAIEKDFKAENLLKEFKNYLKEKHYEYKSPLFRKLDELKAVAEEKAENAGLVKKISKLEKDLAKSKADYVEIYKGEIKDALEYEIFRRYMYERELSGKFLKKDVHVSTALGLLKAEKYGKVLKSN